jgi:hypothetical protein
MTSPDNTKIDIKISKVKKKKKKTKNTTKKYH